MISKEDKIRQRIHDAIQSYILRGFTKDFGLLRFDNVHPMSKEIYELVRSELHTEPLTK